MERIQKEEFDALKGYPPYRKFIGFLRDYRRQIMNQWAEGEFTSPDPQETLAQNTDAVARCQIYGDLIGLKWEDVGKFYGVNLSEEGESDEKQDD